MSLGLIFAEWFGRCFHVDSDLLCHLPEEGLRSDHDRVNLYYESLCNKSVPVGSYHAPFLGYLTLLSRIQKRGNQKNLVWHEPPGTAASEQQPQQRASSSEVLQRYLAGSSDYALTSI